MLAALESALPILQDASPPAVDLDSAKEVIAKVQAEIPEPSVVGTDRRRGSSAFRYLTSSCLRPS
jgi:hypothetical protein